MNRGRWIFVLLYTASGAAALVYEVAWTRMLTLQLGHTVAAASTVLAAFMGGLAVGAWIAPRLAGSGARSPVKLRTYAALELVVAAAALLLPLALGRSIPLLAWAYADGTAPARFALVRIALSLALLGVPAAAMGATFPIAADWYAADAGDTGALYATNTAGAALGAIAAGFWLIPALGLRGTTWVGVALNVVAATGAMWLATTNAELAELAEKTHIPSPTNKPLRAQRALRSKSPVSTGSSKKESLRSLRSIVDSPAPVLACTAAAISGFAALVYEVSWTRLLALVIGPTTYAFATMAAAFISGLAIGSAIGSRIARRVGRPAVWMAVMLTLSAVAASTAAWYAATRLPLIVAVEVSGPAAAFGPVIARQAVSVGILLLPMTVTLGATFTLALATAGRGAATIGRDAARVYGANTLGAVTGALSAGFVLIPALGLRSTFQWTATAGAVAGAGCLAAALGTIGPRTENGPRTKAQGPRPILWPSIVAIAGIGAIAVLPAWDRELLSSGAYKYAPYIVSGDLAGSLRAGALQYYKEGAAATVTVRELTGTRALAIDGKVDASNGGDMLTQRLLGLLPVLLHGNAQEICVIGLGSGVTVGSALAAGTVRHADVVEISREVVEASHFFDRENGAALSNPAVRLIVGDGRSHMLLTARKYDVIVSEPSNPWMSGVATLFTREFFEAARARLSRDGLLCQWAHTYDISADDLQSIVRTFASVFPRATLWLVGESDLLLIGSAGRDVNERLDALASAAGRGSVADALASVGIRTEAAFALLSLYAGGTREIGQFGGHALIQTDDRTALEFSAPRAIYGRTANENAAAIRHLTVDPPATIRAEMARATDVSWTSRGTMELKAEAYALAFDAFRTALMLNGRNVEALSGLTASAAGARRQPDALELLKAIAAREPGNAAVRIELAHLQAAAGDFATAAETAAAAMRIAPDDPRPAEQLASIVADAGDADRLEPLAESLVARFPDRPDPRYYRATVLFMRGRPEEAMKAARQLVDEHPDHARAQNLLGAACATLGDRECAQSAFEASLRANPRDSSTYVNLGVLHLQSANAEEAARAFIAALSIDPSSEAARSGLGQARAQLANPR